MTFTHEHTNERSISLLDLSPHAQLSMHIRDTCTTVSTVTIDPERIKYYDYNSTGIKNQNVTVMVVTE